MTIELVISRLMNILRLLVPLLIGLALVAFLYGAVIYLFSAGSPEKRQDGRQFMLYGLVTLFVMVSVWGLVSILSQTFGINVFPIFPPQLPVI